MLLFLCDDVAKLEFEGTDLRDRGFTRNLQGFASHEERQSSKLPPRDGSSDYLSRIARNYRYRIARKWVSPNISRDIKAARLTSNYLDDVEQL